MSTNPGLTVAAVRPGPRRLVGSLAVTQTVGYGVLYYAFSVILGPMSTDLGISHTTAAGALTTAVLVSGLLSIPVGRWLDARGGRALMTGGSVVGSVAVLGWSQVHNALQLYVVFVFVGVASAMVLYEPAFAVVVAATDPPRRAKALLGVTLVAGFASSIFIPLTGQLVDRVEWRPALVVLAIALAALTIPLHAIGLRRTAATPHHERRLRGSPTWVLRDPAFWLLAAIFVLHGAALAVIAVHLVQYLITLGHPAVVAATLAGLLGLLSVTGRVVTTLSTRWLPMATIVGIILLGQGMAMSLLPVVGRHLLPTASMRSPTSFTDGYRADSRPCAASWIATQGLPRGGVLAPIDALERRRRASGESGPRVKA